MTKLAFNNARRKLLAAVDAVQEAAFELGETALLATDIKADLLLATRLLSVYVADQDEDASAGECEAYNAIFAPERQPDVFTARNMSRDPQTIEGAVERIEKMVALLTKAAPAKPNKLARAVELVLQTVIATDGCSVPELGCLNDVTSRLRQASSAAAVGASDIDASTMSARSCEVPAPSVIVTPSTLEYPSAAPPPLMPATLHVDSALAELDALVGLAAVKQQVETLVNLAKIFRLRRRIGMAVPDVSLHLVFLGNPGTGKTTVARIIARVYGQLGLLQKGHLVEVDRSGLVAGYIGQTAAKANAVVQQSLGGVLFIDEAYALDGKDQSDFGHEAVSTLLKGMEDHRDELVVIAAGYSDRMQRFLAMNPGLESRMPRHIIFDDYKPSEMLAIFSGMVAEADYSLAAESEPIIIGQFEHLWSTRDESFANARSVRNLFEQVVGAQANRLSSMAAPTAADLRTIIPDDVAEACSTR